MGLFDPPTKKIKNLMRVSAHRDLGLVQEFAEFFAAGRVAASRRVYIVAMVMVAYARSHARAGKFPLSGRDDEAIQSIYVACAKTAKEDGRIALAILSQLYDQGWMPEGEPNMVKLGLEIGL